MKLKPTRFSARGGKWVCALGKSATAGKSRRQDACGGGLEVRAAHCGGFTLAEVLAALVFMAIVIPAAVRGLQIASLAGQVAQRKTVAARVADRMLNEMIITSQAKLANQSGSVQEGPYVYRWQMRNVPWQLDSIHAVTMQVTFDVQGQDYDVRLSTLIDTTQP